MHGTTMKFLPRYLAEAWWKGKNLRANREVLTRALCSDRYLGCNLPNICKSHACVIGYHGTPMLNWESRLQLLDSPQPSENVESVLDDRIIEIFVWLGLCHHDDQTDAIDHAMAE
ncbi:hypothetical protein B566_EDAN016658 [Ephemera danica]|nr:hypothetical protein B566_EDAN016658 [Ephemera danica]